MAVLASVCYIFNEDCTKILLKACSNEDKKAKKFDGVIGECAPKDIPEARALQNLKQEFNANFEKDKVSYLYLTSDGCTVLFAGYRVSGQKFDVLSKTKDYTVYTVENILKEPVTSTWFNGDGRVQFIVQYMKNELQ